MPAHRLRAGRQEKAPAQQLADALDAERGILLLELNDLLSDRTRQPGCAPSGLAGLQTRLARQPVRLQPMFQAAFAHAEFLAHQALTEPLLQMQPDGLELVCHGIAAFFSAAASPPRGAMLLLLHYRLFIHVNTPFIIGVSTTSLLKSVS